MYAWAQILRFLVQICHLTGGVVNNVIFIFFLVMLCLDHRNWKWMCFLKSETNMEVLWLHKGLWDKNPRLPQQTFPDQVSRLFQVILNKISSSFCKAVIIKSQRFQHWPLFCLFRFQNNEMVITLSFTNQWVMSQWLCPSLILSMVSPPCNCVNAKLKCIRGIFFKLKPTYSVKKGL